MKDRNTFVKEIPDSIFREMLKRNVIMLLLVALISIAFSSFIYFYVLENRYCVKANFNLKHNHEVVSSETKCHQHLIRILKNDEIRGQLIDKHQLIQEYRIDTTNPYYAIQLDKKLFDDLKVEEQSDGTILVSFIHENPEKSMEVITDLVAFGLESMSKGLHSKDLIANFVFVTNDFKAAKVHPRFLSVLFLILIPVLLSCIILIAIKEKLFMNLNLNRH